MTTPQMSTMLLELYFNGLINKLRTGEVDEVIKDLENGLKSLKKDDTNAENREEDRARLGSDS